jgi:pimeloyl-ACP methyl ester carboxylesterase
VRTTDGVEINVTDLGEGPVVVMIAGFGLDHRVWDRQIRLLAPRHRVICIDQRGHGASDKPLHGYDFERLADDVLDVLGELGVERCAMVGWSFGGQVAFRVAATRPELVERLVLIGSNAVRASRSESFPFGAPPDAVLPAMLAAEHENRIAARRTSIVRSFASPPSEDLAAFLLGISLQMPSWAAAECYTTMLTADQTDLLSAVTAPVLQVIGAADPVHSASGAAWLAQQLGSRLVCIEGCGHYPMYETPDDLDRALSEFLDQN